MIVDLTVQVMIVGLTVQVMIVGLTAMATAVKETIINTRLTNHIHMAHEEDRGRAIDFKTNSDKSLGITRNTFRGVLIALCTIEFVD